MGTFFKVNVPYSSLTFFRQSAILKQNLAEGEIAVGQKSPLIIRALRINDVLLKFFMFSARTSTDMEHSSISLLHTHPTAEIFYCAKGSFQFFLAANSITLSEGEVMVVPSGLPHTKELVTKEGTVWGAINLSCVYCGMGRDQNDSVFQDLSRILNSKDILIKKDEASLCSLFQAIHTNPEANDFLLLEFICLLRAAFIQSACTEECGEKRSKDMDRLIILEDIIQSSYMKKLLNEDIANALSMSKRQLSRFVRTYYNTQLHTLIVKRRLEVATALLEKTDSGIDEIADSVGFSNKTAFYSTFKEKFGTTPLEYRKKVVNRDPEEIR